MDIERINENTVKFFVTNQDIESRGFAHDEIWKNRQLGEQLLWEMLEEVQEEIDIRFEGALKIQVNASDNGLEFIISNSPEDLNQKLAKFFSANSDRMYDGEIDEDELSGDMNVDTTSNIFVFSDFDQVIGLFKNEVASYPFTKLYHYQDQYYLVLSYDETMSIDNGQVERVLAYLISLILEYGNHSKVSISVLEEYGKVIIEDDVHSTINQYF